MGVRTKSRSAISAVHKRTPRQFEKWQDYALIPVAAVLGAVVGALFLSPIYVFASLGATLGVNTLYFGVGCYLMFLMFLTRGRWF